MCVCVCVWDAFGSVLVLGPAVLPRWPFAKDRLVCFEFGLVLKMVLVLGLLFLFCLGLWDRGPPPCPALLLPTSTILGLGGFSLFSPPNSPPPHGSLKCISWECGWSS